VGFARTWVVVPGVELSGEWISAAVGIPSRAGAVGRGKMDMPGRELEEGRSDVF